MQELRDKLDEHAAFEVSNSYLEQLASEYCVKIVWVPKFHCELNPIEGLWCDLKQFVRKRNENDFKKFNNLIVESFANFKNKNLNIKLWNRFWDALEMYQNNYSYQEVLQQLFGAKSTLTKSHKKNTYFNTLL